MGKKKKQAKTNQKPVRVVKKKKVKIKYHNIFFFILFLCFLGYLVFSFLSLPITNIYIEGNTYLSDQEIIESAGIENYPPLIETIPFSIEEKLKKNISIEKAHVTHSSLREIHIKVTENIPLFYDSSKSKTVLKNGKEINKKYNVPILLNYIPDKKHDQFVKKIASVTTNILSKISEIKYDPNDKDDERFLLSMSDGNYVYLSLSKFEKIDSYLNIMLEMSKKFDGQKGILYLDSGGYFKVLEN